VLDFTFLERKFFCIERDREVFELSQTRLANFLEEGKFLLPQVYAIFAKLKIVPSKGASRAAREVGEVSSSDDEISGSHSSDGTSGEDDPRSDDDEEAVDPLALLRDYARHTNVALPADKLIDKRAPSSKLLREKL
jgi:hypothetical protein